MKFNRKVRVEITPKQRNEPIIINMNENVSSSDQLVKFNITKTTDFALNEANIDIYNMTKENRGAAAFKFSFENTVDTNELYGGKLVVKIGYQKAETVAFSGDIVSAANQRVGAEYITRITAQTSAKALNGSKINKTAPRNQSVSSLLKFIIAELDLPAIKAEVVGYIDQVTAGITLGSSESYYGNGTSVLMELQKRFKNVLSFTVDERGLNVFPKGVSPDLVPKFFFSKFNGLIGSPSITNQGADFTVLLEPKVRASDMVLLDSPSVYGLGLKQPFFSIMSITHTGDNKKGGFLTELSCRYYKNALEIGIAKIA